MTPPDRPRVSTAQAASSRRSLGRASREDGIAVLTAILAAVALAASVCAAVVVIGIGAVGVAALCARGWRGP